MAVHHVDVQQRAARIQRSLRIHSKLREIRGQYRRG
jgi:hypothetical protein